MFTTQIKNFWVLLISLLHLSGPSEIFIGDRYSACKPGPKLVVHYTGLVEAPSKVWCEQVTGHSAMIVWNKGLYLIELSEQIYTYSIWS